MALIIFCLFTKKNQKQTQTVLKTVCQNSKVFSLMLFLGRSLEKKGLMVHYSEKSCFYINEKSVRGLTS